MAIVEQRLLPGTKLAEQAIADVFKVSRTVVRQALIRLGRDHLVRLIPARGAFVAQLSLGEAREVFEARALIEAAMIRHLCAAITPAQIADLRRHLQCEAQELGRGSVARRTRLLSDFHLLLARMLGNAVITEVMTDLLARCSLVALQVQAAAAALASHDDHVALVDALQRRDTRAAQRLMTQHLAKVILDLERHPRNPSPAVGLVPAC
jgi:DNA-binding GntR family transcriptional regulator